jgi:hypothetical protein
VDPLASEDGIVVNEVPLDTRISFAIVGQHVNHVINGYQQEWDVLRPSFTLFSGRYHYEDWVLMSRPQVLFTDLHMFIDILTNNHKNFTDTNIEWAIQELLQQRIRTGTLNSDATKDPEVQVGVSTYRYRSLGEYITRSDIDIKVTWSQSRALTLLSDHLLALHVNISHPFDVIISTSTHIRFSVMILNSTDIRLQMNQLCMEVLPEIDLTSASFNWTQNQTTLLTSVINGVFAPLDASACMDLVGLDIPGGLSVFDDASLFNDYLWSPRINFVGRFLPCIMSHILCLIVLLLL